MTKRTLALLVATAMLLGMAGCAANPPEAPAAAQTPAESAAPTAPPVYADAELARAVELGVGAYSEADKPVTFAAFMAMLDAAAALADEAKRPAWQAVMPGAHTSDRAMTRREGMVALYLLAETLGQDYYSYNFDAGWSLFDEIAAADADGFWNEMWAGDYSLFPDVAAAAKNGEASYINAGYFYSMLRADTRSGKTVFDYDAAKKSMHPAEPFTYAEALRAVLRLLDSAAPLDAELNALKARPQTSDADMALIALIDARREAIGGSPSEVTVTGTRYYVSNDGSDANDGLSPESAWATAARVNKAALREGDGVFFRRGDIWRGDMLACYREGITYAAYGEGAKPAFYGSPESGSGAERWSLLEGTDNVWIYDKPMPFLGSITMNGGEAVAVQHLSYWNGSLYTEYGTDDVPVDVAGIADMTYFSDVDLTAWGAGTEHRNSNGDLTVYDCTETGTLYLRCDAGNPGELYDDIEFGAGWGLTVGGGSTVDNLCVKLCGELRRHVRPRQCAGHHRLELRNSLYGRCLHHV